MASLSDTLCCLTHIPACNAVGVDSPSLLELQLLPARQEKNNNNKKKNLGFTFALLTFVLMQQEFLLRNEDVPDDQGRKAAFTPG